MKSLYTTLALLLCLFGTAHAIDDHGSLTILLTNDDGYTAPGIRALHAALVEAGHTVLLVAPLENQSGTGGAFTTPRSTLAVKKQEEGIWSVDGRPVDAVRAGFVIMGDKRPDLVISGINIGSNTGRLSAASSGTIGAALAAQIWSGGDVPALAVNLDLDRQASREQAQEAVNGLNIFILRLIESLASAAGDGRLLPAYTVLNINYPTLAFDNVKGVLLVETGDFGRSDITLTDPNGAIEAGEGLLQGGFAAVPLEACNGDTAAVEEGYIAVAPMSAGLMTPEKQTWDALKQLVESMSLTSTKPE